MTPPNSSPPLHFGRKGIPLTSSSVCTPFWRHANRSPVQWQKFQSSNLSGLCIMAARSPLKSSGAAWRTHLTPSEFSHSFVNYLGTWSFPSNWLEELIPDLLTFQTGFRNIYLFLFQCILHRIRSSGWHHRARNMYLLPHPPFPKF